MVQPVDNHPILILVGPTAIGKTALSLDLAERFNCEIISVDSMQVYKYMDIGTAKVSLQERQRIKHHLIDIAMPDEVYDASRFAKDATAAIKEIQSRNKIPLLTGGTGLYLRALQQGIFPGVPENIEIRDGIKKRLGREGASKLHEELSTVDSQSASRIHENDSQRLIRALEVYYSTGLPWSEHLEKHKKNRDCKYNNMLEIGLTTKRSSLYDRINKRSQIMVESGLESEVKTLLEMGYSQDLNSMGSIGYRHMVNYIDGTWQHKEMVEILARDTRRYAKRQYTWFAKNDSINWFEVTDTSKIIEKVDAWFLA